MENLINGINVRNCKELATILLTKTTTVQAEDVLSNFRVRGLYFLAVVFVATIYARELITEMICTLDKS